MKRLFAWLSGAAGGIALYRLFERRSAPVAELPPGPDARAEELRAKLEQHEEAPPAETAPEPPSAPAVEPEPVDESDPDARRRRVHQQGRAAVHRMRGTG